MQISDDILQHTDLHSRGDIVACLTQFIQDISVAPLSSKMY